MNPIAKHKKKILPPLILIVIIALIAFVYEMGGQKYIGVVEATILSHTAEVPGKILEMPVELGQHVSKGDIIAIIDSTDQEYAYEQLQLTLEKKKLAFSELEVGTGSDTQAENSISIAQANYNSAASSSQKASLDYRTAQSLYNQGAIPKDLLDQAKVKADASGNALTAAKAQLDNAKSGSSLSSAQLDILQTESQLEEMKDTLEKFTVRAVSDGVIMSKSYLLGDVVSPGFNLADLATDSGKYFVFYLPIDDIHFIDYNQPFAVKDGGKEYEAVVKYIDVESEYTPKDMQTPANKNKESVKVKLLLPSECPLKPGMEAEIDLSSEK
ncbi:MAG: HlyD family efflux transporter periplasmic adaptor subunit [Eubacteriales bacterium]|nr:HlyD family efflux transporter periplasmic adaptor subunit [Eubacteriales bacterium]